MGLITQAALVLALGVSGWNEGRATMYRPGLMEEVSARRGLPSVGCMAAHPSLPIGAWIVIARGGTTLHCRVTDTSQPRDSARHIRTKLIELDYVSARALCGPRWKGASRECPIRWKAIDEPRVCVDLAHGNKLSNQPGRSHQPYLVRQP